MRILILGAGGIGGYFGARAAAAGVDVTFLVRDRRAAQIAANGLVVRSPLGDLCLEARTATVVESSYDFVVLACKAYDLDSALDAVEKGIGSSTLILPLLNGLAHLADLDARFGEPRVLGGLAHIGVTLNDAGEILHLNTIQSLTLGARFEQQEAGAKALHILLERGGFAPRLSPDILQDMWEKFAFLAAYAGITCLFRAPIGAICSSRDGGNIARALFDECASVAAAEGHRLRPDFVAQSYATMGDPLSTGTASMLRDLQKNMRTEHDHIMGDMLARARSRNLATPLLSTAYASLETYDVLRRGWPGPSAG